MYLILLWLIMPKLTLLLFLPNIQKNMVLGAVAGIVISLGYILLTYLLDSKIKNADVAEQVLNLPVLGIVPYFEDQ